MKKIDKKITLVVLLILTILLSIYFRSNGVIKVKIREDFVISLKSNPTTGYIWEPNFESQYIELVKRDYQFDSKDDVIGGGGKEIFVFSALQSGETEIQFYYFRPWETRDSSVEAKIYKVKIQ
ncbi:MAG: protease inhibitor I42 family protein [Patescibacteria group bacterium]